MKEILRLVYKELRAIIKDKGIVLLVIGGPILYSFFYPFPYKADIVRNVPVAVVDQDKTYNSRSLIRMLDSAEELSVTTAYPTLEAAYQALTERQIYGIVYLEKDFEKNILKQRPQKVKLYTDGSYIIYYKQVTAALTRVVKTMSAGVEIKKLQSKGTGKSAYRLRAPVSLVSKNLYNPVGGYTGYIVPVVFIAIIHQVLIMGIGMRAGTLRENRRKYTGGVRPWHVLVSKVLAYGALGLFYYFFFFIVMYNYWGLPGGRQTLTFFIYYTPFIISTTLLGVALSGLFKEREGSMMFIIVTSLPIVFMSGIVWPVYLMPWFIKVMRLLFPLTYGATGIIRVFIMDAPLSVVAGDFACMGALILLYGYFAYKVIKKRFPYKT
ncbi:ABC-2 type transport system permease protein [Elusimicrobium simillimum]|uniref:ABC transporter permease n=1 Tax=Elusimicrobium simillimum TaxID=3143438 RepID=UPI003C6F1D73